MKKSNEIIWPHILALGIIIIFLWWCVFWSNPKTISEEITVKNGVITAINPPKHFYITVDFGGKSEEIYVSKHFGDWEKYVWVGKKVELNKVKTTLLLPPYSFLNLSGDEKTEIRFDWGGVKESLMK